MKTTAITAPSVNSAIPQSTDHGRTGPPVPLRHLEDISPVIKILSETLGLYGFRLSEWSPKKTLFQWNTLVQSAIDTGNAEPWDAWMKVTKYKLAAFFAHHLGGQVMPIPPFDPSLDHPGVLLGGSAYRFMRSLAKYDARSTRSLHQTFLNGVKKGCPRPSGLVVDLAVLKTEKHLSTLPPPLPKWGTFKWADVDDEQKVSPLLSPYSLELEIRRTTRELFRNEQYPVKSGADPFFPSTSANYINARTAGGAVGALKADPRLGNVFDAAAQLELRFHGDLLQAVERVPLVSFGREILVSDPSVDRGDSFVPSPILFDPTHLLQNFDNFYNRTKDLALTEAPLVSCVGLAEALKVRVISKGPPLTYTALKPVQKWLWGVLQKHPTFTLIGEPITPLYLLNRLGARECKSDEHFISGDYSDATNQISSWVSEVIVEEIVSLSHVPEDLAVLLKRALTEHLIEGHYRIHGKMSGGAWVKPQATGQLMGSVVSFPILCIANAALCRYAVEIGAQRRFTLSSCPLAINGDDCVFRTTALGYKSWKEGGAIIGLQESLGKTYRHKFYLNMNSTGYWWSKSPTKIMVNRPDGKTVSRLNPYEQIPFINWGLVFGLKRSNVESDKVTEDGGYGVRLRELLDAAPKSMEAELHKKFRNIHWTKLKEYNVPWYVSETFGGLGLPPLLELSDPSKQGDVDDMTLIVKDRAGPSKADLRGAAYILQHIEEVACAKSAPTWKTYQLVRGMVPKSVPTFVARKSDVTPSVLAANARLEAALTAEVFLTQHMENLLDETPNEKVKMSMRTNERLWEKAIRNASNHRPLGLVYASEDSRQLSRYFAVEELEIGENFDLNKYAARPVRSEVDKDVSEFKYTDAFSVETHLRKEFVGSATNGINFAQRHVPSTRAQKILELYGLVEEK